MRRFGVFAVIVCAALISAPTAAQSSRAGTKGPKTTTGSTNAGGAHTSHGPGSKARGSSTATTTSTTPNALSTKLSQNPNQLARLQALLPDGMTLEQATTGFRNQGQFIAALNASKRTGIPFAALQKAMTVDNLSLGEAVRTLQPASTDTTGTTTNSGASAQPAS